MEKQGPVQLLEEAGLVQASALSDADREVISQLSDAEVTVLIEVARRLYPDDPGLIKFNPLAGGLARICVPL